MNQIPASEARKIANLPATYAKTIEVTYPQSMGRFVTLAVLTSNTRGSSPAYFIKTPEQGIGEIHRDLYVAHLKRHIKLLES